MTRSALRRTLASIGAAGIAVVVATLATRPAAAHKPITSKYTYTEDVLPIVSQRCAPCHQAGGVGPMSLLTYDEARPWAESMRAELTSGHMPPWFADTGVSDLMNPRRLSPRELDVLLTWITGGTPRGAAAPAPEPAAKPPADEWPHGRPDIVRTLPAEFTLAANKSEDTREFILHEASDRDRWVASADLRPGNPAIVHDALVYTKRPGQNSGERTVLTAWVPGTTPVAAAAGAGFRWRAGEELAVRVHYRKTWTYEGKTLTDRSAVGLYLLKSAPRQEVRAIPISPAGIALGEAAQALAFRTDGAPSGISARVEAQMPNGSRVSLIALSTRAGWDQRYWLANPRGLPKGTRLHLIGTELPTEAQSRLWLEVAVARQ
jgi:hypothetical protein